MTMICPTSFVQLTVWISAFFSCTLAQSRLSTEGTKFVVYPSRVASLWDKVNLHITTRSSTRVSVKIYTPLKPIHRGGVSFTGYVTHSQPLTYEVRNEVSSVAIDRLLDGILVVADGGDIAVFVNNPSSNASGVTSILSYASLGTNYLFASIKRTFDAQTSILIGNPDGKNEIRVSLPAGPGAPSLQWKNTRYQPGQSFRIVLNQDEFADIRQQDGTGTGDLTGTRITGQLPITVFCAAVFYPPSAGLADSFSSVDKDITIENLPPVGSWGRTYVVKATPANSSGDYVRVMSAQPSTDVVFSNGSVVTLPRAGSFVETEILPGDSFLVQSAKPVQVIQYRHEFTEDSAPFMFLVPSVETYGVTYTVPIIYDENPTTPTENHIVLITHICFADRVVLTHDRDTRFSGQSLVSKLSSWERVGNSDYVTSEVRVGPGFVTLSLLASDDPAEDSSVTVGGFFFGMGTNKAYAAPLGLRWISGNTTPQGPPISLFAADSYEPVKQGKSSLVLRDKLPLALPISEALVKSRVACHHECWTDSRCVSVAYKKQRVSGLRGSLECLLYGPTSECSGTRSMPDYLLYKLNKTP